MKRKLIEAEREQMEFRDPLWSLYKTEGPTYEEIANTFKPPYDPTKQVIIWVPGKGWGVEDAIQGDTGSHGRNHRKVSKSGRKPADGK